MSAPAEPPRISAPSGPPAWEDPLAEAVPDWDALAQAQPERVFDPRVPWYLCLRRLVAQETRHALHPLRSRLLPISFQSYNKLI